MFKKKRLMFFGSTGSVEEYLKSLEKFNNQNALNMTSQRWPPMARNGSRIIYSHLLNSTFSYQFMLKRKRFMSFGSIGSAANIPNVKIKCKKDTKIPNVKKYQM